MIGMAIAKGARRATASRRHAHGHGVRRLVSRLHRLRADLQEHRRRSGPRRRSSSTRRRTTTRSTTFPPTCATCVRRASTRARGRRGWWRLRDAVDYMETGVALGARVRRQVQGRAALESLSSRPQRDRADTRTKPPFAYVIPQAQRDPGAAGGDAARGWRSAASASHDLTAPRRSTATAYPAGTWVIPTDQEFAAMAREVLDAQKYPDLREYPGGPPERPYDAAGWTLPCRWAFASSRCVRRCPPTFASALRGAMRQGDRLAHRARRRAVRHRRRWSPGSCHPPGRVTRRGTELARRSGAERRVPGDQSRARRRRHRAVGDRRPAGARST